MRRNAWVALALWYLFSSADGMSGQSQRVLLSVDGLSIPQGGALAAFHIDTWGVVPLTVCKVPPLWDWSQAKYLDSAGLLAGQTDHRTLSKLDRLYLADVYLYQPLPRGNPKGEYHPATFAGWYTVFDGDGDLVTKHRTFHANNFHLTPASRCPDVPPAEP